MAVEATTQYTTTREWNCPAKKAFDLLADVPDSASHYPKVDQLIDKGDGAYRWEMEKIGAGKISLQTVYTSRYVSDEAAGTIVWDPVDDEGTSSFVSGNWKIESTGDNSCKVTLDTTCTAHFPFPKIMKGACEKLLKSEVKKMTEKYLENIRKTLES
jgi:ribosome-associated toxin RatA of RatAB toxin-antitoxin module